MGFQDGGGNQRSPDPLAVFKEPTSKWTAGKEGGKGKEGGRGDEGGSEGKEREEREGAGPLPQIFWPRKAPTAFSVCCWSCVLS